MNGLKVIGAVVTLMCLTASAKQDKKAPVPKSVDSSRARVAMSETLKSTTPHPEIERCILLIGGDGKDIGFGEGKLVEYYHPTAACNITPISTLMVEQTEFTSGCFLPGTQQIVIREEKLPDKPPVLIPLSGGAATALALPYSEHTSGSTSAMVGGRCVSCGGWADVEMLNECYSFSTTHWTSLPPMPHGLSNAASVALGAVYYVIGGRNSTSEASDQVYQYNTKTNQWLTGTPMDDTRVWHSAAALSDTELIVCGGWKGRETSRRDCTVYSATSRRWSRAADLNYGRDGFAMVVFGGRVYALGGKSGNRRPMDHVEVYDRAADRWTIAHNKLKDERFVFVGLVV